MAIIAELLVEVFKFAQKLRVLLRKRTVFHTFHGPVELTLKAQRCLGNEVIRAVHLRALPRRRSAACLRRIAEKTCDNAVSLVAIAGSWRTFADVVANQGVCRIRSGR